MGRVDSDRIIDDYDACGDDYVSPGLGRIFEMRATMRILGEIPPLPYAWDEEDEEWP